MSYELILKKIYEDIPELDLTVAVKESNDYEESYYE